MDFVSTRIGHEICNIAKAALAKYLKGTTQYCKMYSPRTDLENEINQELSGGAHIVVILQEPEEWHLVVYEK